MLCAEFSYVIRDSHNKQSFFPSTGLSVRSLETRSVNLKPKRYYMCQHKFFILPTLYLRVFSGFQNKAIISICSINLSLLITEAESVYCAVRTRSLTATDPVSSLKVSVTCNLNYFCSTGNSCFKRLTHFQLRL